jgi:hypothetical protein
MGLHRFDEQFPLARSQFFGIVNPVKQIWMLIDGWKKHHRSGHDGACPTSPSDFIDAGDGLCPARLQG